MQEESNYTVIKRWTSRPREVDRRGYVRVWVPHHPRSFSGGWVYEHRLVIEKKEDRILKKGEQVHHINENKQDNSIDNLFLCRNEEHLKAHDKKHIVAKRTT